jgi:hypothetical protein
MESVMSTDFRPERNIFARDLFDGRLAKFGVNEWKTPLEGQARCLTDGQGNYLWVSIDDDDEVVDLTENGWDNNTDFILAAVAEAFEIEIFSEHEPQYWGCETNDEFLDTYFPSTGEIEIEFKAEAQLGHRQVGKTSQS